MRKAFASLADFTLNEKIKRILIKADIKESVDKVKCLISILVFASRKLNHSLIIDDLLILISNWIVFHYLICPLKLYLQTYQLIIV
jgi:hypothetical protein